jgi:hypothetical protein
MIRVPQLPQLPFKPASQSAGLVVLGFLTALSITVVGGTAPLTSNSTNSATDCDIKRAADFAIQSNLQMINSTTVNPGKFFTPGGPGSCISGVMLQNFDLSNLIPDFMSIISGALESAINNAINGAMRSVCNAANNAVQNTVGQINSAVTQANNLLNTDQNFTNLLGSELGYGNVAGSYPPGATYGVTTGNTGGNNAFGISSPGAAANTQTALQTMDRTWNSYLTAGRFWNPADSYQNYIDQVNAYNRARAAEGLAPIAPNPPVHVSTGTPNNAGSVSAPAAGSQVVGLAAAREQARLNVESTWSSYLQSRQSGQSGQGSYQTYLNAVDAYNSAVQAETAAQAQTAVPGTTSAFTPAQPITPQPPLAGSPDQSLSTERSGSSQNKSNSSSVWGNIFNRK